MLFISKKDLLSITFPIVIPSPPAALCDPTDIIWIQVSPFEGLTGCTVFPHWFQAIKVMPGNLFTTPI